MSLANINLLSKNHTNLQQKVESLVKNNTDLQIQVDILTKNNDALTKKIYSFPNFEKKINELIKRNSLNENLYLDLERKYNELFILISDVQEKIETLSRNISSTDLEEKSDPRIISLLKTTSNIQRQINNISNNITELKSKINTV